MVAQSAGGNADFVGRRTPNGWAERFAQQIVVDNRPGGAGISVPNRRARLAGRLHAALAPTGHSINPGLYPKLPFDPQRDFPQCPARDSYAGSGEPQSSVRSVRTLSRSQSKPRSFTSPRPDSGRHASRRRAFNAMAGVSTFTSRIKARRRRSSM